MILLGVFLMRYVAFVNGDDTTTVVGGNTSPDHKYPYQVSLRTGNPPQHFCSGSIIHEKWILTAAHCVDKQDLSQAIVVAGTNYLTEGGESYKISCCIVHPDYEDWHYEDIALLRMEKPILFNSFVVPIPLPQEDITDFSVLANFAGWGRTENRGAIPNELQEIKLKIISFENCKKMRREITEEHVCTLNDHGHGTCQGDSGGPLTVNGEQVGITSYSTRYCAIGYPDVFTKVWAYTDWIEEVQEKNATTVCAR
ncbi:chymotrypsin-1-like [Diachasmimorpha longicaudata]|uniref:chymotrypsin-1-like n=1 Tax=Diachasmimorpha longicaudata TaxID=58733 RepID=UPI0030B8CFD3